jgi:hypothetical protein
MIVYCELDRNCLFYFIYFGLFCLFVCILFKDTINLSDCIASNEYIVANNELEMICKKPVIGDITYCIGISLERLKKAQNIP